MVECYLRIWLVYLVVIDISRAWSDISADGPHSQVWLPSPCVRHSADKRRHGFQRDADRTVQWQHAVFYAGGDVCRQRRQHRRRQLAVVVRRLDVRTDLDVYFHSYRVYVLRDRRGVRRETDRRLTDGCRDGLLRELRCLERDVSVTAFISVCSDQCRYCWWLGWCHNIWTRSCVLSRRPGEQDAFFSRRRRPTAVICVGRCCCVPLLSSKLRLQSRAASHIPLVFYLRVTRSFHFCPQRILYYYIHQSLMRVNCGMVLYSWY